LAAMKIEPRAVERTLGGRLDLPEFFQNNGFHLILRRPRGATLVSAEQENLNSLFWKPKISMFYYCLTMKISKITTDQYDSVTYSSMWLGKLRKFWKFGVSRSSERVFGHVPKSNTKHLNLTRNTLIP
jgi:hypothetical protein